MNARNIGAKGELLAARYLREHGYDIITSNFRCRLGEIDIIAENKQYLCFVEVKTRGENPKYAAADAVNYQKRRKIIATAKLFLTQYALSKQPRFDVIEVYLNTENQAKINFIENAFDADGKSS